ncbi:MAG: hypothetical protein HY905_03655 [Deltaproteobacteria bacterium]|nr:hypothetical protein [Deltaproteobacteria bacterium]
MDLTRTGNAARGTPRSTNVAALVAVSAALLGSCALYGDRTGPPPGPVASVAQDGPPPERAGALSPVNGNGAEVVLAAGIYEGDLLIRGNGNRITGAGYDRTIIEGALRIVGDANVVGLLRVRGESGVVGDENDVRAVAFDAGVELVGEGNLSR